VSNLNLEQNEKKAQSSDSSGKQFKNQTQDQTKNNANAEDIKDNNTTKSKTRSIQRCPKCRSINPPDAKYCQQCGKVFRTSE
jgi:ribosomal protein L40E